MNLRRLVVSEAFRSDWEQVGRDLWAGVERVDDMLSPHERERVRQRFAGREKASEREQLDLFPKDD